ncbi:MAG: NUDIX domain-containing protein [Verrucomicrobia subdivision 3 bacterium]|nr:NUDIX domain-containing protein [Limisphaerales bacterium]
MASERVSAGLVMYRRRKGALEILLAHPGGPYFARKDEGHWSIPKGEIEPGEDPLRTAIREFEEEVGIAVDPASEFIDLGSIRQKGGKVVHAWGVEGDCPDGHCIKSNHFSVEWPPGSGKFQQFPEVDQAGFFTLPEAKKKVKATQIPLLERLASAIGDGGDG